MKNTLIIVICFRFYHKSVFTYGSNFRGMINRELNIPFNVHVDLKSDFLSGSRDDVLDGTLVRGNKQVILVEHLLDF